METTDPEVDELQWFIDTWSKHVNADTGRTYALPRHWRIKVHTLVAAGLTRGEVRYCVRVAMRHRHIETRRFPYFMTVAFQRMETMLFTDVSPEALPPQQVAAAPEPEGAHDDAVRQLQAMGTFVFNLASRTTHRSDCMLLRDDPSLTRVNDRFVPIKPGAARWTADRLCGRCLPAGDAKGGRRSA